MFHISLQRFAQHDNDCGDVRLAGRELGILAPCARQICSRPQWRPDIQGKIDNRSIEVLHTGVGENICRQRIGKFLVNQQFDFLISAGFAGSLNHQLQVNDLLVAKNFSTVDLKKTQSSLSNVSITAANMSDGACVDRFQRGTRKNSARIGSLRGRHGNRIHCTRLRGPRNSTAGASGHHRYTPGTTARPTERLV